jgi:hypothetical protein
VEKKKITSIITNRGYCYFVAAVLALFTPLQVLYFQKHDVTY